MTYKTGSFSPAPAYFSDILSPNVPVTHWSLFIVTLFTSLWSLPSPAPRMSSPEEQEPVPLFMCTLSEEAVGSFAQQAPKNDVLNELQTLW